MTAATRSREGAKRSTGRADWSTWPAYDAADSGLEDYWYPVLWSNELSDSPVARRVCGHDIVLLRGPDFEQSFLASLAAVSMRRSQDSRVNSRTEDTGG